LADPNSFTGMQSAVGGSLHRSVVRLRRGDLANSAAACLVTPANDALVGNLNPLYWRFISRVSVDAAVRKLGGEELEAACEAIAPVSVTHGIRRDITRWTTGCKEGPSAVVRCPAGSALCTPAFGRLQADHVVHAVAPDSEFGYEGLYTGNARDVAASGVQHHSTAASVERRHSSWQQFSPPDDLLFSAYRSAFSEAARVGASTVACPALGSGVKGWRHSISAALALEAFAQHATHSGGARISSIDFVIGGFAPIADKAWSSWTRVARELLGAPPGLESAQAYREASGQGELVWEMFSNGKAATRDRRAAEGEELVLPGMLLPLLEVMDVREMLRNRKNGYCGTEIPLTPEQELRAVSRRQQ